MKWRVCRAAGPHPSGRMSTMVGAMRHVLFSPLSPLRACEYSIQMMYREATKHTGKLTWCMRILSILNCKCTSSMKSFRRSIS